MPMQKYYIPRGNGEFYIWQANFVNRSVTNQVAWGFPAAAVAALVARRAQYEPLYLAIQNENTRTRTGVLAHNQMRAIYEKELRAFVRNYCGPLADTDKSDLRLTIRDLEPTPRGKINDIPYIKLKGIGGGDIRVRASVDEDQTKSSMHDLADAVECRYILVPKGEMPPEGQKDAKTTVVSKKALFIISCGDEQAGETFWGFFRWVNQSNPANSGQWSHATKVVIA